VTTKLCPQFSGSAVIERQTPLQLLFSFRKGPTGLKGQMVLARVSKGGHMDISFDLLWDLVAVGLFPVGVQVHSRMSGATVTTESHCRSW